MGTRNRTRIGLLLIAAVFMLVKVPAPAQQLAKRLILKDGSYQLATKWEIKGDRVRYLSAERDEWEELPNSLVDWAATDKFEKDRAANVPAPEAVELDKEIEAERRAEEAKTPQVAPGLHLPDDGGMLLLDTFQTQPQLVVLQQNTGELNRNKKTNILRSAVIPVASSKQTIELDGLHASVQAHATLPTIYVNLDQDQGATSRQRPGARDFAHHLRQPRSGPGIECQFAAATTTAAATGTALGPFSHRPAPVEKRQAHRRRHKDQPTRQKQPAGKPGSNQLAKANWRLGQDHACQRS